MMFSSSSSCLGDDASSAFGTSDRVLPFLVNSHAAGTLQARFTAVSRIVSHPRGSQSRAVMGVHRHRQQRRLLARASQTLGSHRLKLRGQSHRRSLLR
jgi:hypothetical protein